MGIYEDSLAAFRAGETGRAEELALGLLSLAREDGDIRGQIDALCMLARVALRRGDLAHVSALGRQGARAGPTRRRPAAREDADPYGGRRGPHARRLRRGQNPYEESIEMNVQLGEQRMVAAEHRNLA
jgi:hypothetical protein